MGHTDIDSGYYKPPYWMSKYTNLKHCKFCDAVYNSKTQYVKAYQTSTGTQTPTYEAIRDCKPNVCPCCER